MKRRHFLTLGTTVSLSTAGCLGWSPLGSNSDTESNDGSESDSGNNGTEGSDTNNSQERENESSGSGAENNTKSETQNQSDATGEGVNESGEQGQNESDEEERKATPDENDTEIDREQYNESSEPAEVEELPEDAVEISATYHLTDDESGVIVNGDVTNVTADPIDFVDLRIIYYNEQENEIGEDFVVVRELRSGQTKSFEVTTPETQLQGDVAAVGGIPTPQNYVD